MSGTAVVVAFGAGFVSFLAPCVLPLVPGYLSAVSSVEAERLGEPGAARRVVVASLPFVGRARRGVRPARRRRRGGRALDHAQPVPARADRRLRPDRLRARRSWVCCPGRSASSAPGSSRARGGRGSGFLLGGAFAVCAAPCIGPVLGSILVLAGDSDTVLEGSVLLAVYALGLAIPFLVAAALFAPAMGLFRRVRDHYAAIQFVSGLMLVSLGALLFAGEFWRLRVYLNRLFEALGPQRLGAAWRAEERC